MFKTQKTYYLWRMFSKLTNFAMFLGTFVMFLGFVPHKFYVSNTIIEYSQESRTLQITAFIFLDDFEKTISRTYGEEARLGTSKENPKAENFIEDYMNHRLKLYLNQKIVPLNYIGTKYNDIDLTKCFIESPEIDLDSISFLSIQNTLLIDDFPEQQNIVTVRLYGNEDKTTAYLTKDKTQLTLKLK